MINEKKCAHCQSYLTSSAIFNDETDINFCCNGCKTAYEIINNEGCSSFYKDRRGWTPGKVDVADIDKEIFEPSIITHSDGFQELTILLTGIRCASCVWLIENVFIKDGRLKSLRVNYANHRARIIFDPNVITLDEIINKITQIGYCPLPYKATVSENDKVKKDYFFRFGVAAFFSMQLMVYSLALYAGYFQGIDEKFKLLFHIISWGLTTPVLFYSGLPFFKNSLKSLKHFHFNMDSLVAIGSTTAYVYSIAAMFLGLETYFDTTAMIITLILLGRYFEAGAKQKASDTVDKLISLQPKKISIIEDYKDNRAYVVKVVPIDILKVGDYFEVDEGAIIGADGVIVSGTADIDESMLTGEPMTVEKSINAEVFTGTRSLRGRIVVKVTKLQAESFLSKIAKAVEDAEFTKAGIQDITDSFIGKFVPFVLLVSFCTFGATFFYLNLDISVAVIRAVSVLIIACPCAMGLATPLAIISASAKLSEIGVIFKNGEAIERYAKVNDFYFDKTGTVTKGKMYLADYKLDTLNQYRDKRLISSVARLSKHPASKAISLIDKNYIKVDSFSELAGLGVEAKIGFDEILIGSLKLMKNNNIHIDSYFENLTNSWTANGFTLVYASIDKKLAGVFCISDIIRRESKDVIDMLQKNKNSVTVLTGDNYNAAKFILNRANIDCPVKALMTPFEKAEVIKNAKDNRRTAMIGDGINDAVALTAASVGIAMSNGTNISIDSASAVLLRDDLNLIIQAHKVCKKALRIIKENLFWAFSYNIIAIPLAVTGLIHPVFSAIFMSVSSILVVLNSLRIKK